MSVDSKESSSEEVKVEDESNAPKESGVKNASQAKSKGKKISIKKLSPTEIIKTFEDSQINKNLPEIYVGDTVRVGVRISEGNKERVFCWKLSFHSILMHFLPQTPLENFVHLQLLPL